MPGRERTIVDRVAKYLLLPALGLVVLSVYISFFRSPDIYWERKSKWEPGAPTAENHPREPGRNGFPPCFRIHTGPAGKKVEVGDCVLLTPDGSELHTYQVDLRAGHFLLAETDLYLPDSPPIVFTRSFRAWRPQAHHREIPPPHLYDIFPTGTRWPYTFMYLNFPDGEILHYPRISPGSGYQDAVYEHTGTRGPFHGSRIKWNGNGWALKLRDGAVFVFPEAYSITRRAQGALVGMRDPEGNILKIERDPAGRLTRVTSAGGHWLEFGYSGHSVIQIDDSQGRTVKYGYDTHGRLAKVLHPDGTATTYQHDASNRLREIREEAGAPLLRNEYDPNGRVRRLTLADGSAYRFRYTANSYGNVTAVDVLGSRGKIASVNLDASFYTIAGRDSP
jgi:YD repeat-containing protein